MKGHENGPSLDPDQAVDNWPKRVQRKRTKGWRMPAGTVYVGRPSRWGNPFPVGAVANVEALTNPMSQPRQIEIGRDLSVLLFREWLRYWPGRTDDVRKYLAGRDLACWCPLDQPCHADVLLEVANRQEAS